jgi:hypothetical protein
LDQIFGVAVALADEAEPLMDGLRVAALEPRCAVAFDRRPKVRNRSIDLSRTRAAAVGKPIGKASARGSYRLSCGPRQNTTRDSEFAGGREQTKRTRDALHLAICATCVPLGKHIDEVPSLNKTCLAVSNERFDKGRSGGAKPRLCCIRKIARQRLAAILLGAAMGLSG